MTGAGHHIFEVARWDAVVDHQREAAGARLGGALWERKQVGVHGEVTPLLEVAAISGWRALREQPGEKGWITVDLRPDDVAGSWNLGQAWLDTNSRDSVDHLARGGHWQRSIERALKHPDGHIHKGAGLCRIARPRDGRGGGELMRPALNSELEMLLLGADGGNVEDVRRLARSMHAEIGRMRRLVEDLLTLAQHARALAHGQRIETDALAELPRILADPDRLEQALLNVLDNALKYTPGDGVIRIVARPSNAVATRTLLLEVSDTGAGAPPEAKGRLFDRFYRADAARTRGANQPTGAGLGLSIVKSLIEAQGGQIMITSKQWRGTTVTFAFPIIEAQVESSQPSVPSSQHASAEG